MSGPIQLSDIPSVLDDDDEPFVIRVGADRRPYLEVGGARYRRSASRCVIDVPYGGEDLGLRAAIQWGDEAAFLTGNVGPSFNDWWPTIRAGPVGANRPFLAAGASESEVTMLNGEHTLGLRVLPSTETFGATLVFKSLFDRTCDVDSLAVAGGCALCVIKGALLTFLEYRTLFAADPEVNVVTGDRSIPLTTVFDAASEMADVIDWTPGFPALI